VRKSRGGSTSAHVEKPLRVRRGLDDRTGRRMSEPPDCEPSLEKRRTGGAAGGERERVA